MTFYSSNIEGFNTLISTRKLKLKFMTNLPEECENQEIGRLAARALYPQLPTAWIEKDLDGDTDFGIDFRIQLKNKKGQVNGSFYLQLKGSKSLNYLSKSAEISFKFSASTLNYYRSLEPAVMVAVVDLAKSEDLSKCPIYFKWLDEDFLDQIKGQRERNSDVSIRLDLNKKITPDLDIFDYYQNRVLIKNRLTELRRVFDSSSADSGSKIDALTKAIKEKPIWLEAINETSGAPWITNPDKHNAGKLKTLQQCISNNDTECIDNFISEIGDLETLTNHEDAEFRSLKASWLILQGKEVEASTLYGEAYSLFPSSRYKINYFESKFKLQEIPDDSVLEGIVSELDDEIFEESALKAKCLAMLEKESEALNALEKHPPEKTAILKLLVFTICENSEAFWKLSSSLDIDKFNTRDKMLFHIFMGRKLHYQELNLNFEFSESKIVPTTGIPKQDIEKLKKAIFHIRKAINYASSCGYPYEIHLIFDVSTYLFSYFNCEEELIDFGESVLKIRPCCPPALESLITLTFNSGKYSRTIELIDSVEDPDAEQISILLASYYHAKRNNDFLTSVEKYKEVILTEKPQNYVAIFTMAAQIAFERFDMDSESKYLNVLDELENGTEHKCVYFYIKNCNANPENRSEYNASLYNDYKNNSESVIIAQQLYPHLDINDSVEQGWISELARTINGIRELSAKENLIYAYALVNSGKWELLEELCAKIASVGQETHEWLLLKAASIDGQGRSGEALDLLENTLLNDKSTDLQVAENYVRICFSLGFFKKAEEKLIEVLGSNIPREKKLSILESLLFIYSSEDEYSKKIENALTRYGALVDQNSESEEGNYLLAFLMLTSKFDIDLIGLRETYQDRLHKYLESFPNSKILRKNITSPEADGKTLVEDLNNFLGIGGEKIERSNRNTKLIRQRRLPSPYIMLPAFILSARDIFDSWGRGKYFGATAKEYTLVYPPCLEFEELAEISQEKLTVFFDETSLLVLYELGLLDKVLKTIELAIIAKSTYADFSRLSHAIFGSTYSGVPKGIVEILGANLDKILLKGSTKHKFEVFNDYLENLSDVDSAIFCCDDLYLSIAISERLPNVTKINSVDLVDLLSAQKLIDNKARIEFLQKLCELPIENPGFRVDHITNSIEFWSVHHNDIDLLETGFYHIYDAVFQPSLPKEVSFNLICEIFIKLLNGSDGKFEISNIGRLVTQWMVRFPILDAQQLLARWFIRSCLGVNYHEEHELLPQGIGHAKLWGLFSQLHAQLFGEEKQPERFDDVCIAILNLSQNFASDIYEDISRCFIEYSQDYIDFSSTYTRLAIPLRLRESKQ